MRHRTYVLKNGCANRCIQIGDCVTEANAEGIKCMEQGPKIKDSTGWGCTTLGMEIL